MLEEATRKHAQAEKELEEKAQRLKKRDSDVTL